MPNHKPYTHVRPILDDGIKERYEVRVSTFIEFDSDPGRRAISQKPSKEDAEAAAKEIARKERIRTGAPE
jgi:hypothetical protein